MRRILQRRDRIVRALRRVVHRRHVDGQRIGRGIQVHAAIRRTAVVLHLEGEESRARRTRRGRKTELARNNIADQNTLANGNRNAVQCQRADRRQGCDSHSEQGVCRHVIDVTEAKIPCCKDIGRVFRRDNGCVCTRRRIIHRCHVDRHRIGACVDIGAAVCGAAIVLNTEGESCITRTVGVRHRRKHQKTSIDIGNRDALVDRNRDAVQAQGTRGGQRGNRDR